jgi:DNA-directed RNA polymerase subunit RPC12/RpoP
MAVADDVSPPIYRCERCGALVHPADAEASPYAWCARCRRIVRGERDGGPARR